VKWLREYYMIIVPALAFFLLALALAPFGRPTAISVPVEYCKSQFTGRTKTEEYPVSSCAAYDSKMNCTVPVTNWVSETRNEAHVTCEWIEWK
jgi:hypothetical protein